MKHTIILCDLCGDIIHKDFWNRLQKGTISIRANELKWVLDSAHYDLHTKRPTWMRRKYYICPKCVEKVKTLCKGGLKDDTTTA